MTNTKPELPIAPGQPWTRITIDETPGSPFAELLRTAGFAADRWTFGPDGPYKTPQTPAQATHGQIREALLHLLELGFIDVDVERLNVADWIPTSRERAEGSET
jgi:hypothetical protein